MNTAHLHCLLLSVSNSKTCQSQLVQNETYTKTKNTMHRATNPTKTPSGNTKTLEKTTKSWESIAEANLTASKLRKLSENQTQKKHLLGNKKSKITDKLGKKFRNQI